MMHLGFQLAADILFSRYLPIKSYLNLLVITINISRIYCFICIHLVTLHHSSHIIITELTFIVSPCLFV